MVERFHRQLKGVLKCLQADSNWTEFLPLIMLGIRNTIKEDLQATPAEMVYGTTLTLPADLVNTDNASLITNPVDFVETLRQRMNRVQTALSRPASNPPEHMPTELADCEYVFMRTDSNRTPLQRPYTGPYKVVSRNRHTFTIRTNHGLEDISLQRLKPARVDPSTATFDLPNRRGRPRLNVSELELSHLGGSDVAVTLHTEDPQSSSIRTSPSDGNSHSNSVTRFQSRSIYPSATTQ